jgi:hypothetical protein
MLDAIRGNIPSSTSSNISRDCLGARRRIPQNPRQHDSNGPFACEKADLQQPGKLENANHRRPGINCVRFGRTADYAATLTKGTHVQFVGEIQPRNFVGKDGTKTSVTEIRVRRIARLDRASKTESIEEAAV